MTQLTEKSSGNLELGILQSYSEGPMVYFKENYFSEVSEGFHRFQRGGGGELFSGLGVKMLISIETYRNFPGGGGGSRPYPTSGFAHALIFKGLKLFSYPLLTTLKHTVTRSRC